MPQSPYDIQHSIQRLKEYGSAPTCVAYKGLRYPRRSHELHDSTLVLVLVLVTVTVLARVYAGRCNYQGAKFYEKCPDVCHAQTCDAKGANCKSIWNNPSSLYAQYYLVRAVFVFETAVHIAGCTA